MASNCGRCTAQFQQFKQDVSSKSVASQQELFKLASFNAMCECVQQTGFDLGVDIGDTLNAVESYGAQQASGAWKQAVDGIDPARRSIQRAFIPAGTAPKHQQMSLEEFRGCQIWLYGLATRLQACHGDAKQWASEAGLQNPLDPISGYDEAQWNPQVETWQRMENCVRRQAHRAGTDVFAAWRAP